MRCLTFYQGLMKISWPSRSMVFLQCLPYNFTKKKSLLDQFLSKSQNCSWFVIGQRKLKAAFLVSHCWDFCKCRTYRLVSYWKTIFVLSFNCHILLRKLALVICNYNNQTEQTMLKTNQFESTNTGWYGCLLR